VMKTDRYCKLFVLMTIIQVVLILLQLCLEVAIAACPIIITRWYDRGIEYIADHIRLLVESQQLKKLTHTHMIVLTLS